MKEVHENSGLDQVVPDEPPSIEGENQASLSSEPDELANAQELSPEEETVESDMKRRIFWD